MPGRHLLRLEPVLLQVPIPVALLRLDWAGPESVDMCLG